MVMQLQNHETDKIVSYEEEKIITQDYYNVALTTLPSIDLGSTLVFNHQITIQYNSVDTLIRQCLGYSCKSNLV